MQGTENVTASDIWAFITWGATALVLLANAWEKIAAIIRAMKAPNAAQDDRLETLEKRMANVEGFLAKDKIAIDGLKEGDKVTKHAILALLGHGIDGNNTEEMIKSKHELETYLIER